MPTERSLPTEVRDLPGEKKEARAVLDAKSPRKFRTPEGPGRRCYGHVTARQAGTYTVLLKGPNGTHEVASVVVAKPTKGRKVALRVQFDATEIAERPAADPLDVKE